MTSRVSVLLLVVLAGLVWLWSSPADNPLRSTREQGMLAKRDHLSAAAQGEDDPAVRFAASLTGLPPESELAQEGASYVPAYARIRLGSGRGYVDLATTLSVHNTSREVLLVLKGIAYYDTAGTIVRKYLARPVALRPLATIEVFVPQDDVAAGSGANFIVDWATPSGGSDPAIEAVMIGTVGTTSYAFVSAGRRLQPEKRK